MIEKGIASATTAVLLLPVSFALLTGCYFVFQQQRQFHETALSASGTVIDLQARRSSEGNMAYAPIVEFTTREGETRVFTSSGGWCSALSYSQGDRVSVLYQREDPGQAQIDSLMEQWGIVGILLLLGSTAMLAGGSAFLTIARLSITGLAGVLSKGKPLVQ